MHNVVAVEIPDGVDGDAARAALLDDFGIEIGTSFGPLHGKVWRIGTMGYNARKDAVLTTLAALEQVLRAAACRSPPAAASAPRGRCTHVTDRPRRSSTAAPSWTASPPRRAELERVYLSPEHARANAVAGRWMEQAGLRTWQDAAGNSAAAARAASRGCRRCCSAPTSTPCRTPAATTGCSAW